MKLIRWGNQNTNGWFAAAPVSFIGDVSLSQGNFYLLITGGRTKVVINFTDKNGKPREYIKTIEGNEFDFLTEK